MLKKWRILSKIRKIDNQLRKIDANCDWRSRSERERIIKEEKLWPEALFLKCARLEQQAVPLRQERRELLRRLEEE